MFDVKIVFAGRHDKSPDHPRIVRQWLYISPSGRLSKTPLMQTHAPDMMFYILRPVTYVHGRSFYPATVSLIGYCPCQWNRADISRCFVRNLRA